MCAQMLMGTGSWQAGADIRMCACSQEQCGSSDSQWPRRRLWRLAHLRPGAACGPGGAGRAAAPLARHQQLHQQLCSWPRQRQHEWQRQPRRRPDRRACRCRRLSCWRLRRHWCRRWRPHRCQWRQQRHLQHRNAFQWQWPCSGCGEGGRWTVSPRPAQPHGAH